MGRCRFICEVAGARGVRQPRCRERQNDQQDEPTPNAQGGKPQAIPSLQCPHLLHGHSFQYKDIHLLREDIGILEGVVRLNRLERVTGDP